MSHQRGDNRQVHATVHQVRGEAMAECPCGDAGPQASALSSGSDNVADVFVAKPPLPG